MGTPTVDLVSLWTAAHTRPEPSLWPPNRGPVPVEEETGCRRVEPNESDSAGERREETR